MRTTITFEPDVAAAVEEVRRQRGVGVSEAVNGLVRAGLTLKRQRAPFRQRTVDLGLRIDVTNVAEAIEELDGPTAR